MIQATNVNTYSRTQPRPDGTTANGARRAAASAAQAAGAGAIDAVAGAGTESGSKRPTNSRAENAETIRGWDGDIADVPQGMLYVLIGDMSGMFGQRRGTTIDLRV